MGGKVDIELFKIVQKLPFVLGYDYTSRKCKLKTSDGWIDQKIKNVTTMMWYNHFVNDRTFSLPIHNPNFSNILIFDIDDNQPGHMTVNDVVNEVKSDFEFFYREEKSNGKGAHLFCYCESPIYLEAKKYLIKHYRRKGMIVETEWSYLRLPYSSEYREKATDQNDQLIRSLGHLQAVFATKDSIPMKIPAFLKPYNKHGYVIQKDAERNSSGISIDDIVISRGDRVEPMIELAFYAIGENMSIQEYATLCDSKEDPSHPSKDLHGRYRNKEIENIYNWAEKNYNQEFQRSTNSEKPKFYLDKNEWQIPDDEYEMSKTLVNNNQHIKDIKFPKVKKRRAFDVILMYEKIRSKSEYHKENMTGKYTGKHAELNEGIALDLGTIKLMAESLHIKNWREVWKIVKEVFLEPIRLASGFYYSYCNIRHAIHYKISSVISLFNSLVKSLYSKKTSVTYEYYYNICRQVSSSIHSRFSKILQIFNPDMRAGPI